MRKQLFDDEIIKIIIILLGIRLSYIFGIITYLGLYFLTADNKETMNKMCNKLGLSSAKLKLS